MRLDSWQVRLVLAAGALTLAGCATADLRQGVVRHETPKQIREKFHGPEVSVRAFLLVTKTSRRIQPTVSVADSAYILVGNIGDDGTLRILYPANPGEPNFVRKTDKFRVPAFLPRTYLLGGSLWMDSKARAFSSSGNVFVIASSTPLQLEKLAEGDRWSLFDVYYDNHATDPKPGITDLAAAISPNVKDVSIAFSHYGGAQMETTAISRASNITEVMRRLPRPPR